MQCDKRVKKIPILLFALLMFLFPGKAISSDLDIFTVTSDDVAPNVLLVFDVSGSMRTADVEVSYSATKQKRLDVAKVVVKDVIEKNPTVRWGLFTFPNPSGTARSGQLVSACKARTESELETFIGEIDKLSPSGSTPIAASLAEAGLYYAGEPSFFWSTTYTSPIENVCQNNYIILITDGYSNYDSGIKGGYSTTNDNRLDIGDTKKNDSIFLKDNYINNVPIQDYITRNSTVGDPDSLGAQLSTFVTTQSLKNKSFSENTRLLWGKIESGTPTNYPGLKHAGLAVNQQLTITMAEKLKKDDVAFVSGYNEKDPSRPFQPLRFSGSMATLAYQGYIKGTQIYQANVYDGNFFSDYLDDVAAFLRYEDLRSDMGTGTMYEKQYVKTYVVGYMFDNDLLKRTAIMGGTGEKGYMTANNYDELKMAFSTILNSIKEEMSVFASPALPPSGDNELYTGRFLYMALFKPSSGYWIGNLKRYTLDAENTMSLYLDANGAISADAASDWSNGTVVDGSDVALGGAARHLNLVLNSMVGVNNTQSLRRIYTFTNSGKDQLKHSNNLFIENNSKLTQAMLDSKNKTEHEAAITSIRLSPLGAIMHSTPVLVWYGTKKVVYAGANDGFLHAFHDEDTSVTEAWAFVFPEHFKTIASARSTNPSKGNYFVDGSIAHKTVDGKVILISGLRRGGESYVALNVTDFEDPYYKYVVDNSTVSWNLGQSWGMPRFIDDGKYILIPGGYDTRYDTLAPSVISGAKGAGIIGINADTGAVASIFNDLHGGIMQHSILDVAAMDVNSDTKTDTLYYGDLGGNIFYASAIDPEDGTTIQTDFASYILFKTPVSTGRRFPDAPAMLQESGVEYVYFGSGDRESPLDDEVENRFYCVKNKKDRLASNADSSNYLTDMDLTNITANKIQVGTDSEKTTAQAALDASCGWYLELGEGEKVTGTPAAFDKFVIFTTYQPTSKKPDPLDICKSGSTSGIARLYTLNYLNGSALMGEETEDRCEVIGNTIPSAPVLSVFKVNDLTVNVKVTVTVGLKDEHGNQSIGVIQRDLGNFAGTPGGIQVFYWREFF